MTEFGSTSLFDSETEYNIYDNLNSSLFNSGVKYNISSNTNWTEKGHFPILNFTETIIFNVILFTLCFLGLLGNGNVIWILSFHMKRNPFSIYILNLAVADSGVLLLKVLIQIFEILSQKYFMIYFLFLGLYFTMYNASQLLLVSLSVDRCGSVLFPIWHQCRQPPKLSLVVCAIAWVLPFIYFALEMVLRFSKSLLMFQLIFNALFSYPLVVISTLILLIKIVIQQRQKKLKKVLTVTLLVLLCFIVLRLPPCILSVITYNIFRNDLTWVLDDLLKNLRTDNVLMADIFVDIIYRVQTWIHPIIILAMVSDICIAVNSSINPILYFLAGRNNEDQSRVSMKLALRRVFRNEEDGNEDETQRCETQL